MKHVVYHKNRLHPKGYTELNNHKLFIKINLRFNKNVDKVYKNLYFDILEVIKKYYVVENIKRKTYRNVSRLKRTDVIE